MRPERATIEYEITFFDLVDKKFQPVIWCVLSKDV